MRVLILSDRYLPDATGTALRISRLLHSLLYDHPRQEIHVATLTTCLSPGICGEGDILRSEKLNDVNVYRFASELSLVKGLRGLCIDCQFDLIHARGIRMGLYAKLLSLLVGIPYIIELNSVNPQRNYLKTIIWTRTLRSSKRLIVLTKYAGEWLNAEFGFPEDRIDIVMNGVDLDQFQGSDSGKETALGSKDSYVVGYAGTFLEWQGVFSFVHAAFLIALECPEARFLMVGDGPAFRETKNLVDDYGLTGKFTFTGLVDPQEVPAYMQKMDIFLIPRPPEFLKNQIATPLKLFEAMAMECAVVVSSVHGLSDVVDDGHTGLVADPMAQSLADAVLRLIKDKDLRVRISATARRAVLRHYTWESAAKHLHQAYLKSLA
jgi:glycosyltransferase involved in cell wall biosynthesis